MFVERVEIRYLKGTRKRIEKLAKQLNKLTVDLKREALIDLFNKYERKTTSN